MVFIDNEGITNPRLNLALEEYALRNFSYDQDYLIFYINEPSIIIGRNQNTLEEINDRYVNSQGIHVVRRISGGGAVYHDLGNLNFSFITNYSPKSLNNFREFTKPIVQTLNAMGVNAELQGRNDLVVNERKISGNAQHSTGQRMFSHGTLLFDSDMDEVTKALDVKMSKIESKGHKSVRSRVANIREFLDEPMDIETFRDRLMQGLYENEHPFETYHLTKPEWKEVRQLKDQKYGTWEWNYGRSPIFNIKRAKRFAVGEVDLRIDVEDGHIANLKIYGDFFGRKPVEFLEKHLAGRRYERNELEQALKPIEIEDYFGALPKTEFLDLIYGEDE